MGKIKNSEGARKGSIDKIRLIIGKAQAGLSRSTRGREYHFVVIATKGWEPERFIVELGCLNNPEFLRLLKQAEEEFGFSQEGALAIPCRPDELQSILGITRLIVDSDQEEGIGKREVKADLRTRVVDVIPAVTYD
ncbi:unnamed protein product [Dovyalis caffra]|uniref:Small auxin up regulated protein n=1 Tax=Dovyalis caffra TaxID=77055 RepID=A0AAV1RZE7_9ROSI|nr:unnamed protein product [Dovyalis caffra]